MVEVKLSQEELELLLTTVKDYRWVGDFNNGELDKMKKKLKYYINKNK